MRRGVIERLEFIEFRLFWEGRINRSDIIDRFKISTPQASKDLSLYEAEAPGNLIYDTSGKRYLAAPNFQAKFFQPDAANYLAQLRNVADHTVTTEETWLDVLPESEAMPIPHRRVSVQVLRSIIGAIRNRTSLDVRYQSMNEQRSGPMWRTISPHALGHDGLRWHVRAFCHLDKRFKDFLLSRCLESGNEHEAGVSAREDKYWNEFFSVVLIPNPKLSADQQAVISQDYCMEYGQIAIPVRKALLYYFRKRLRLDVAEAIDDDRETPVVVLNQKAFDDAVAKAAGALSLINE
jgi:predicted DNA-binding transcriptional regulator YafY